MSAADDILAYLRKVNPTVVDRAPDTNTLKIRRVLDSLDMMEFITFLETTYSIKISDQDVLSRNFETVHTVVAFLETKRATA